MQGHIALVTGGGRGIGEAIAIQLASAGVAVAVVARGSHDIDEVASHIVVQGGRAIALAVDFANPVELASICSEVRDQLGPIDILINNGAIIGPLGPFSEYDMDEWMYTEAVNLLAPVRLTRMLLPTMLEMGWGRVVNISTGALNNPKRNDTFNAYIASKAGLEAHTMNLAAQIAGTGVTANVLHPGVGDSLMQAHISEQEQERIGLKFHTRFLQRNLSGQLIQPVVSAMALGELVFSDRNGEIVSVKSPDEPQ